MNQFKKLAAEQNIQGPATQWFDQKLDHFNHQDTRTWKQRYFVNDSFWQPGNPIFVEIGGEGAISSYDVVFFQEVLYAKQHGALFIEVEHRFYGESAPLPDLSLDNLRYLSSQQALADAALFISSIKQTYNSPDSPVITFGGSYPGNLAAWFRLKYPTVTLASVASSAPVQATLDFFQYLDVVDKSLQYFAGEACDNLIQQATDSIQQMLTTPSGQHSLQELFKTCEPLSKPLDISLFAQNVMGNFMGTVQYNDENGNAIDITKLCDIMKNNSVNPLQAYADVNTLFLQLAQTPCLDVSYENFLSDLTNTSQVGDGVGDRQWTYQTCTQFGYFQTTDSTAQPFGDLAPLNFSTQMCNDAFGPFPTAQLINETNVYYGGNQNLANGPTNILFVNGNIDPWHALSVTENVSETVTAILINGTAHCANMFPAGPNEHALAEAQAQIAQQISLWLDDYQLSREAKVSL